MNMNEKMRDKMLRLAHGETGPTQGLAADRIRIAATQVLVLMDISETLMKSDNPRHIVSRHIVPDGTLCSGCGAMAGMQHGPDCRTNYARVVLEIIKTAENRAMATDGAVPPDHEALSTSELVRFFQVAYKLAKAVV